MKMKLFFSLLLLTGALGSRAQLPVKDKAKASVINNIEFMDRQKLQPEWYHYNIWYQKILGIKIPMPGLGLHNNYAKKDMRLILQETPMLAAVAYNKSKTEDYHEEVDKVFKQETMKFADKTIDYQYSLTQSKRRELISAITKELTEYSSNGGDSKFVQTLTDEVIRINANVTIIKDSHMANSKKREAYIGFEKELMEVHKKAIKLNRINKVVK